MSQKNIKYCFIHIPKTGGTFINYVLRSLFGIRHVDVIKNFNEKDSLPVWEKAVGLKDIKKIFKLHPFVNSIASHFLMPTNEMLKIFPNAIWFSVLRSPKKRIISDYKDKCRLKNKIVDFYSWAEKRKNLELKMLSGKSDIDYCINYIRKGNIKILLQEQLNADIELLFNFNKINSKKLTSLKPKNVSSLEKELDEAIREQLQKINIDFYIDNSKILYEYIRKKRNSNQNYFKFEKSEMKNNILNRKNVFANKIYRNLIYKPLSLFSSR
ncbi:MAG: sulfotransferase family 2 domain-containing protein [Candidatus Krumholzibacteriota bacterium]|nr:sulfotransferase family 2 domain-containing protein [Candidatus Krumholzibacteriota bacterium]